MAALAATLLAPAVLQAQNVTSILQVLDTRTGQTRVVREFPYLIEAPNWTIDGNWLIFNSGGQIWRISPTGGDAHEGYIGFQDHGDDVWFRNIRVKILD